MKLIIAIIKPFKLDEVRDGLSAIGVRDDFSEVKASDGKGPTDLSGRRIYHQHGPKVRIEIVASAGRAPASSRRRADSEDRPTRRQSSCSTSSRSADPHRRGRRARFETKGMRMNLANSGARPLGLGAFLALRTGRGRGRAAAENPPRGERRHDLDAGLVGFGLMMAPGPACFYGRWSAPRHAVGADAGADDRLDRGWPGSAGISRAFQAAPLCRRPFQGVLAGVEATLRRPSPTGATPNILVVFR